MFLNEIPKILSSLTLGKPAGQGGMIGLSKPDVDVELSRLYVCFLWPMLLRALEHNSITEMTVDFKTTHAPREV